MKKALLVVLTVAIALGYSASAQAESMSSVLPLSLTIVSEFGFTLSDYAPDFSDGAAVLDMYCRSNNGNVWYLKISAPEFSSALDTIPSDPNFVYAAWSSEAAGTWVQNFDQDTGGSARVVPTAPETFYTSTGSEGSDPFTPVTVGMWMTIPAGQVAGLYETNVTLTMTE